MFCLLETCFPRIYCLNSSSRVCMFIFVVSWVYFSFFVFVSVFVFLFFLERPSHLCKIYLVLRHDFLLKVFRACGKY